MSKFLYIIDSGHGGMINGVYQTAPAKMYDHGNGEVFYEGVWNRAIKGLLIAMLDELGISYIDLCPTELDIPLSVRVNVANLYHEKYPNAVLLSIHSNAGKGTGFEVWTSIGQTRSDKFGEVLAEEIMRSFPGIKFRPDRQDGDLDKESQFYILKHTNCPAVLPECLFYDNKKDYDKLVNYDFQRDYVGTLVRWIETCETLNL